MGRVAPLFCGVFAAGNKPFGCEVVLSACMGSFDPLHNPDRTVEIGRAHV